MHWLQQGELGTAVWPCCFHFCKCILVASSCKEQQEGIMMGNSFQLSHVKPSFSFFIAV